MVKRNQSGQALVEVSLVLPVLGLGIAVAVLLICYGHNLVCVQMMAAKAARRVTVESPSLMPIAYPSPLWGRVLPPTQRANTLTLQPWRSFNGAVSTVDTPGHLRSIEVKSRLFPGLGFSRHLPILVQKAQAEMLLEPLSPPED